MSGVVVILNGYPGVGKSSVARELAKQLPNAHVVQLHHLEAAAASVHPDDNKAYEALAGDLTSTLLASLRPSASTPVYLIPTTILASSPHRERITPFLQLGTAGFLVVHIILSSSTEVNITRLLSSSGSPPSSALARPVAGGPFGGALSKVVDEASLLEMRMEDEVLRLMSGIIGRRTSGGSASGSSIGDAGTSVSAGAGAAAAKRPSPTAGNSIEGLEHHLSAEYEIDTSRLDAGLTGMMAAEYVMDVMRKNGVLSVNRKSSR